MLLSEIQRAGKKDKKNWEILLETLGTSPPVAQLKWNAIT